MALSFWGKVLEGSRQGRTRSRICFCTITLTPGRGGAEQDDSCGRPEAEAEAPENQAVTNDRQQECQGLGNPFLFLNRLTARK